MLGNRERVSVVMAVYNGERYIEEQIVSILEQTIKLDEFIIVDDNSIDSSIKIITECFNRYGYSNYKIIRNNENVGFIRTFLKGIKETSGDYIFLADQDDIWLNNKVESILEVFAKKKDMLSVCSSFTSVDKDRNKIKIKYIPNRSNNNILKFRVKKNGLIKVNLSKVIDYNISPGCTCTFRKEIKKDIDSMKIEKIALPHDWMINVFAASHQGLYFYNKKLIEYRQHSHNTIGIKKINECNKRISNYYNMIEQKKYIKEFLKRNKNFQKEINICDNIIASYNERIKTLRKKSVLLLLKSYLKAAIVYNICTDNYYIDLLIILKEKI